MMWRDAETHAPFQGDIEHWSSADRLAFFQLKSDILATRFLVKALRLREYLRKANFDPNQPRKPAGQPGGGQWTDGGTGRPASTRPTASAGDGDRPPLSIDIWPSNGGPPLDEEPPPIPEAPPAQRGTALRIVRTLARWTARAAITFASLAIANPAIAALVAAGIVVGHWLYQNYSGYIFAYLEPPKTLEQLQRDVLSPRRGTDVHHIVEQTPAEAAGDARSQIDAPDNLVRISTFRHWTISGYYSRFDPRLGASPREYLRTKDWEERRDFGLEVLKENGVLIP